MLAGLDVGMCDVHVTVTVTCLACVICDRNNVKHELCQVFRDTGKT